MVDGDWAQISYTGKLADDAEAAPITGEDTLVEIGGKDTVEAFNAVLRGAKPGQELKAEVIYPADYPRSQASRQDRRVRITVKGIKKRNCA